MVRLVAMSDRGSVREMVSAWHSCELLQGKTSSTRRFIRREDEAPAAAESHSMGDGAATGSRAVWEQHRATLVLPPPGSDLT